ncbi:MAG: Ferredoxin, 2Fe-2S [uncultured Sphingomonas sp.]|uniref:Ferredoxin, 2Fe-2S n=1 Tax=uncultured Sphingomonas sp. TaxID=158754 RepID=A0A6J4TPV3_9SPHN|nr:MAG: Ferredoxin, 2Fe-2S [uncultured Sphingomonas sp.]
MTLVRFLHADGSFDREVEAPAGSILLEVAQDAGQPLEGTCGGQISCSTCHVIVAQDDFDRLPRASEEEDDLLDLAAHVSSTSRLACQIVLSEQLGQLTVRLPGGHFGRS